MESVRQDLRFAFRSLRKHPGFTAIAVATLALGIGANAAMFAVVNGVILRPLPFADSDRLVRITSDMNGLGNHDIGISPTELYDYRDRADIFQDLSGVYPIDANLTEVDQPERVEILLVSPSYFSMLGVRPQLGRVFTPDDNHPGIAEVVVVSDALWKRRFGGRADAIGKKLRIDGDWYELVGVMPPGFRHPGPALRTGTDMWAPAGYRAAPFGPLEQARRAYVLSGAIGRLKPGVTLTEANDRLAAFAERLRVEYPTAYPSREGWAPRLIDLHEDLVGRSRLALVVMLIAVGLVLLIACANIAGLLLARGAGRFRELGIRRALGAGRLRLARLLMMESVLVAGCGGVAGLVLAGWAKDLILALAPTTLPRVTEVNLDARVMLFALVVTGATALLFGFLPAWHYSKPDILGALKDVRGASAPNKQSLRSVFVVAELALAMVLLVGATLLVRSFWRVMNVDPGIDPQGVLTARLWLPQPNEPSTGRYFTQEARLAFYNEVLRRARELPNVESAAIAQALPLDGRRGFTTITIDGVAADQQAGTGTITQTTVSPDYFAVMRIPVRSGRGFDAIDSASGFVALINEEAARTLFAGQDPVGRRFYYGRAQQPNPRWVTVIGVVGDVLTEGLEIGVRPTIYRPLTQTSSLSMAIAVRTTGDPKLLVNPLTRAVTAVDPDQPMFAVRTMEEVQASGMASRRFAIQLLGGFASLALVLAAIGIYGVMAYLVGQRTREIGIRIALGARRGGVVRLVVGRAVRMALLGVGIGGVVSLIASQLVAGMLFGVEPWDPVTFSTIAGVLALTAIAAAAAPAMRAARVDPMIALRAE